MVLISGDDQTVKGCPKYTYVAYAFLAYVALEMNVPCSTINISTEINSGNSKPGSRI